MLSRLPDKNKRANCFEIACFVVIISSFMSFIRSEKFLAAAFFLFLIIVCCAPVWSVEYFINQDGSAHLYSSHLMLEIIKGNPLIKNVFELNSLSVPNSSGHWLMVLLLNFIAPLTITKIMVTLTFAGIVGGAAWLRLRTVGFDGIKTAMMFGAAVGFNWLWLGGFYNFLIGVGALFLTVGLIYGWREKMNLPRAAVLSLLFLMVYLSHIISFVVLAGSIFLLLITVEKLKLKRNLIFFFGALAPVLPLMIVYKAISSSGGGFYPAWRSLENPFSLLSWFAQLRTADSFIIISRRNFPFIEQGSNFFAVFAPVLWIFASIAVLGFATLKNSLNDWRRSGFLVFGLICLMLVTAALFAPDDFGLNNGSILRERLLICGLLFFVPLFRAAEFPAIKRLAQFFLAFVIIFQTAALWDYALRADREARAYFSVQTFVPPESRIASVILIENGGRFNAAPTAMINNYLGIGSNRIVWDNYEIGHYLFPVVAKNEADKSFVFDLTRHSALSLNNKVQDFEQKLQNLDSVLNSHHQKIQFLIVWGRDPRVYGVLNKWFTISHENERVRVLRHK